MRSKRAEVPERPRPAWLRVVPESESTPTIETNPPIEPSSEHDPHVSNSPPGLSADEGIAARETAPLTARGSHIRRARRRNATRRLAENRESPEFSPAEIAWRVAVASVVVVGFLALTVHGVFSLVLAPQTPTTLSIGLVAFGTVASVYFLLTLWHALRYRPFADLSDEALPSVTVIVPAYNEGPTVRVALESALNSDYPEDRMEVIAIDDGSKDDTWEHIQAVAEAFPDRVIAVRHPQNRGKREALRTGFLRASGEIAVTVDSDSKLDRRALRAIVAPLVTDREVAAVAGRVRVLNRNDSLLTRLLAARFFITFDLARAAQSRFGAVLCTPGALSAYRMSAVREVLDRWSEQTFLGQPCTIAEDRALTTWLLRSGYRSVYQRTAIVDTMMPSTFRRLARMLVRWERGNIREDLVMLPLLFTRWRPRDRWWPTLEIALELLQYPAGWIGLSLSALSLLSNPSALWTLVGLIVWSAIVQSLYCLRSERGSDFIYSIGYALFAFVGLQWVFPYSLLTVRDGRWLTR